VVLQAAIYEGPLAVGVICVVSLLVAQRMQGVLDYQSGVLQVWSVSAGIVHGGVMGRGCGCVSAQGAAIQAVSCLS